MVTTQLLWRATVLFVVIDVLAIGFTLWVVPSARFLTLRRATLCSDRVATDPLREREEQECGQGERHPNPEFGLYWCLIVLLAAGIARFFPTFTNRPLSKA